MSIGSTNAFPNTRHYQHAAHKNCANDLANQVARAVCFSMLPLAGQLACLSATDLYRYLSQEHEATTVGVLVGMAAARRGSQDPATAKMLFLHVPARHPGAIPDLDLPPLVQAAALLGVGLLHQGSCHRHAPQTWPPGCIFMQLLSLPASIIICSWIQL